MKVLVILRKLNDGDKVVHDVLLIPKSVEESCIENWADDVTTDAHRQTAQQFVEFAKAKFTYEVRTLREI